MEIVKLDCAFERTCKCAFPHFRGDASLRRPEVKWVVKDGGRISITLV
jgi:hypothetical protein